MILMLIKYQFLEKNHMEKKKKKKKKKKKHLYTLLDIMIMVLLDRYV